MKMTAASISIWRNGVSVGEYVAYRKRKYGGNGSNGGRNGGNRIMAKAKIWRKAQKRQ
jgi:hypothetical protein